MLNPETELNNLVNLLKSGDLAEDFESMKGLRPAFVSIVGSWNYNLADEDSDVDFKVTYWPTFDHFYGNRFPKVNVVTELLDFTVAPIHHFMDHMLKGNINFLEVAYTAKPEYIWIGDGVEKITMIRFMDIMRELIPMNAIKMIMACSGTALQKFNRRFKYTESTRILQERSGYNTKEMAHAIRQLYFIKEFLNTGSINLNSMIGLETVAKMRAGKFNFIEAEELFHVLDNEVSSLVRVGKKWTDRVLDLDGFGSDLWSEKTAEVESLIKGAIRRNLC